MDYEIYETPQLKKSLPQPVFPEAVESQAVNPALLSIEEELRNEEEELSCVPPPVGVATPKKIQRISTDLKEKVEISYEQLVTLSIQQRKDWKLTEIEEAWRILNDYEGRVNDLFRFIEGTIENLRRKERMEKFKQADAKCQKTQKSQTQEIRGRPPTEEEIQALRTPGPLARLFQKTPKDSEMQLSQTQG